MKKICKAFIIAVSAFLTLGLAGCKDAIVNDGTTVKSYTPTDGSGAKLFAGAYDADVDFKIYAWGNTVSFSPVTGGMRITTLNSSGWFGGGLAQQDSTPDLTFANGVKKIVLEVRGNLTTSFYYILPTDGEGATNDSLKVTPASETEWEKVEVLVSKNVQVATALAFNQGDQNNWEQGAWIEIRNIDWVDDAGNSVSILKK